MLSDHVVEELYERVAGEVGEQSANASDRTYWTSGGLYSCSESASFPNLTSAAFVDL